jgi:hypothetical protein
MKGAGPRTLWKACLPALAFLVMLVPAPSYAHPSKSPSTQLPVALTLNGAIADAGRHSYTSHGGQAIYASVLGQVMDLSTTTFSYKIHTEVDGAKVTGDASFELDGQTVGGVSVSVRGNMPLNGMQPIPAEQFPVGCTADCNSEIVAFYLGVAHVHMFVGNTNQETEVPMSFESAFLNPFGGPIIIASLDNGATITVVSTYTEADIHWLDVELRGTIGGTLNGARISGQFTITGMAKDENLLAGTESESGTMTFSGMNDPTLDLSGSYVGTSTIPTTGTVDCSSLTGIPGTCTETGFYSQGSFSLGGDATLTGTYQTTWFVPALGFDGSATATLSE